MTVSNARPLLAPSLAAAVVALRARGLRVSTARRLVLEALFAAEAPVTAEAVAGGRRGSAATSAPSTATSTRSRRSASSSHVHLGHGPGPVRARRPPPRLGGVRRVRPPRRAPRDALHRIRAVVRETTGFDARFAHFPIVGLCPDCSGGHHAHP